MQLGDPNGIYRRALAHFPDQAMVKRYMDKVCSFFSIGTLVSVQRHAS